MSTLCPAPDPLLTENDVVTENVPALQLQETALLAAVKNVPALQLQKTALMEAGERQALIDKDIARIVKVSM